MRPIPDALRERFLSDLQTAANNADPKLSAILTHETVTLESSDFLERALITETAGLTACSVAVRRPVAGTAPDAVYAAYIDENGPHVKKSALSPKLSALAWTDVTPSAIENADDIAVAFDGSGDRVTDSEPWVFWIDYSGVLYATALGSGSDPVKIESEICTKVSAVRGFTSMPNGKNIGFVVFYIRYGNLYCKVYNGTIWGAAEQITLGPSDVTWTDATAFRTHDTRVGVQAKASNGKVYEIFSMPARAQQTYIQFSSEDNSNFTLEVHNHTKHWPGTLYYSTDTFTWSEWDGTTVLSSFGGILCLRGTGNNVITGGDTHWNRWELTSGKRIHCTGNIENLLNWESVAAGGHPSMIADCFYAMFKDCTSLVEPPELPATTLGVHCYHSMFSGCTSLETSPALPATTLTGSCYTRMFEGCTSLVTAPELPATTLHIGCYGHMFSGCTSLKTAPALPATTLKTECYDYMFSNCTALTTAPELPATTLSSYCYRYMFEGCISIKISIAQDAIYQYPFRIPTSGEGTTASNAMTNMFKDTGGSFTGTPEINTTYYTDHPLAS